jgi:hypothetical protein
MTKHDIYKLSEVPVPNYDAWEFRTRITAKSKGLLDMISGIDVEPSSGHNSKAWKAWKARQDAAAELLVKALEDDQLIHVHGLEDEPDLMWERLRTVHEKTGTGSASDLWKKFHGLMYTNDTAPLRTHIGTIRAYAEHLDRLHNDKPSDTQIISRILSSLPPSYATIIKILESHSDGNKIDYVIEHILAEETRHKEEHDHSLNAMSVKALQSSMCDALKSNLICENPICKAAGQTGHLLDNCFWPGGGKEGQWPEWWKKKGEESTPHTLLAALVIPSGTVTTGGHYAL